MTPGERLSARECLEKEHYSNLWSWYSLWEIGEDVIVQAENDTQALLDKISAANALASSRMDASDDMTFETISGLKVKEQGRRDIQGVKEDDKSTVRPASPVKTGRLYDPAHVGLCDPARVESWSSFDSDHST